MGRKPVDYGFKFGQFVHVRAKYVRRKAGNYRWWEYKSIDLKNCLYIGVRTLTNGRANHEDKLAYKIDREGSFRCAVVVESEYKKPINVPFDSIG